MKRTFPNHYERAFVAWLRDNRVQYVAVDEKKRALLNASSIKSFDYLLYAPSSEIIIAEVKGRKFTDASFTNLSGFQCWVTSDDVDGLSYWQDIFGPGHTAAFVFAYHIEKPDVDYDGRPVYHFGNDRYIFFAVRLEDYCRFMTLRSPKWKTVSLPAEKFRNSAVQMQDLLL